VIAEYCDSLSKALEEFAPAWRETIQQLSHQRLISQPHGDQPRWLDAISMLPAVSAELSIDDVVTVLSKEAPATEAVSTETVKSALLQLRPWRKGPFNIFSVAVDTEWRSDWKWQRILPHIQNLSGRTVLDVGCGSGYHCWRMLEQGARGVLGIDPTLLYLFQFLAIKRYAPDTPVWFAPVRLEEMPVAARCFDTVFSMGVLYHRRSPLDHLLELFSALTPGGELVLETLVIEGGEQSLLIPEDRYAAMRNVFFLPSTMMLERWLRRCGFVDVRTVDVSETTVSEQRSTEWMNFQSLTDFLDPANPQLTIEGYPAPQRAVVLASRPD